MSAVGGAGGGAFADRSVVPSGAAGDVVGGVAAASTARREHERRDCPSAYKLLLTLGHVIPPQLIGAVGPAVGLIGRRGSGRACRLGLDRRRDEPPRSYAPILRTRPTTPCGAMKTKAITSTPSRKLAIGPLPNLPGSQSQSARAA